MYSKKNKRTFKTLAEHIDIEKWAIPVNIRTPPTDEDSVHFSDLPLDSYQKLW